MIAFAVDTHTVLDSAVLAAYGFDSKKDLLAQLFALNLEAAKRIEVNQPVTMGQLAVKHGLTGPMLSAAGMALVLQMLDRLRQHVEADGELTEAALQEAIAGVGGHDVALMRELDMLRSLLSKTTH